MNVTSESKAKAAAIAANLAALNDVMTTAAKCCAEAQEFAQGGESNGAIGALLDLDSILDDAKALYGAAASAASLESGSIDCAPGVAWPGAPRRCRVRGLMHIANLEIALVLSIGVSLALRPFV